MNPVRIFFFLLLFFSPLFWREAGGEAFAQRSKHGARVVAAANTRVNEYTALTANAAAGATTITVSASTLNATARFPANLAAGDLIMIIQMQGAAINGSLSGSTGLPTDSTWGAITAYNNCGNWEFAEVTSVPNGTTITLDCPLTYSYTASGKTQVVRVPRYSSLTINNLGVVTCDPWNGTIGGVCAIEVENNTIINTGGSINTTGNGFRGGQLLDNTTQLMNLFFSASTLNVDGAEKGEGIAGYKADYTTYGGMYMRGAPANGGGGSNIHNGGGGGGANGGNPAAWNGHGMPDNSGAGYSNAWELQYVGFSTQVSSGGGQGGYSFSQNNDDPTLQGPGNNGIWGGQGRFAIGGYGGRPLDYSTGRLFLGGGGGSGDQNDNEGGAGANGGGLIYLMNYGTVSTPGTGSIISNGNNGSNTTGATFFGNHRDGAGGGGAGGTIIINSVGAISGISITANGGNGGNQLITAQQAEGPGGGGGGGYIAISNPNAGTTRTANGGANGTTTSTGVNQFPPNGATMGGVGTNTAVVTNFVINAANTTICAGQSATLTATLGGTPPGGTTIIWYDALVAGNVLPSTGGTYTTPVLSAGTYTYYAASCPGTYRLPVQVTVTSAPAISVSPNSTICNGDNTTLTSSGGTTYSWSPVTGLSNPNISNPVASPAATTTYVVTISTACGPATASVVVTVNSSIVAGISGNTTICTGGSTTLTASGGATYSWSTGSTTTTITVAPTINTGYSVTAINGSCTATTSITVNVAAGITASIAASSTTICPGSPTTLTASGGSSYSWSTTETTNSINVAPTTTTTYSVTATSGVCTNTTSITLTVSNNLASTINGPTNICIGGSATLTATGGGNYAWSTTETTASITVTPTSTASYSVLVTAGTCTATASATVNVGANITASITGNTTICAGVTSTLSASGGGSYTWNTGAITATISINPAPSTTTTYTVIATSGGCADTTTITVTTLPALSASASGNTTICQGNSATLTASLSNPNNNTYLWSTGATTTTIQVIPAVTTTFTVIGYSGTCSDTAPVVVTVLPQASATVSPSTTICVGQSAVLWATGGSGYAWNTGAVTSAITVSPFTNTTYTVIVGLGTCTDTDSVSVTVMPSPTVTVTNNTSICGGSTATLNASGGTGYAWSNGATSSTTIVSPASTTTYSVVTTNGICTDTGYVTITVSSPPVASITGNSNICQGLAATLTAASGASYAWSTGETTAIINPTTAGTYSVVVSTGSCTDTAFITTAVVANPIAAAFSDTTIIQGKSANLSATGGATYVWDNSMTGANITVAPLATTTYCVTVYDANSCSDTACVTVTVVFCSATGTLYLPNSFSPNADLENDDLQIYYGIPACLEKFHLVLYNRWGEKVYETSDGSFKWDGSYTGRFFGRQRGNTEVYMYYMDAEILDGTKISKKGNISLLR